MANDFTKRPMEIDTAGADTGTYDIKEFEYHPGAADNDLEIQDTAGNVLWKVRAQFACANNEASNILYRTIERRDVKGINVVTIDGGTLYIHIATRNIDQN
jgi:hypothetical protein